jgi:type VI secretion system protein ImpH
MSFIDRLVAEPWRFDFFSVLRHLEKSFSGRPRIGDSASRRDEFVQLGQDPFLEFPASNLSRAEASSGDALKVFVRHLGLLGPQGALPIATTEEGLHYLLAQDDAFPRFLDLFNQRFLGLFFRAWADARPIAQHDRPAHDRFVAYVGSAIGIGSSPYQNLDTLPDAVKLCFAGVLGAQAKSASRLAAAIEGIFGVLVQIDEFVPTRLKLEAFELTRLSGRYNELGRGAMLGRHVFSIQDKILIRIFVADLQKYKRFLPSGDLCEPLADLVYLYNGEQLEWAAELAIPADEIKPICLGQSGQLGWISWMSSDRLKSSYLADARFHPSEYFRRKRQVRKREAQNKR